MPWTKTVLLVSGSLVLIGCGSSRSARAAAPPIARLVTYANCMRHHGVPNFPDPDRRGNLIIVPGDRIDPASPQFKRAESVCKRFDPERTGPGMTPAQHATALAAMTRYTKCMRKHGVPMADPFSGPNGGVRVVLPRNVDPSSLLYARADAACKHLLPNGG